MLELGAWYRTHFVLKSSETHIFQMGWLGSLVTGHRHHTRHWRRGWPGDPGAGLLAGVTTVTSVRGQPLVCVTVQGVASVCCVQCADL